MGLSSHGDPQQHIIGSSQGRDDGAPVDGYRGGLPLLPLHQDHRQLLRGCPNGAVWQTGGAPRLGDDFGQGEPRPPHHQLCDQHCHLLLQGLQIPNCDRVSFPAKEKLHLVQDLGQKFLRQLSLPYQEPDSEERSKQSWPQ